MGKTTHQILVLAGGLIPICWMIIFLLKKRKLISQRNMVEGEIVEFEDSGNGKNPVVKFTTLVGDTITKKYNGISMLKAKIGDKLVLYYDSDKPSDFTTNSAIEKWIAIFIMIFSLVSVVISFVFFPYKK